MDQFNNNISSLYQTKHSECVPQLYGLIPTIKTSPKLWESLSKEILTPFAPKFRLFNFEKYLPHIPDSINELYSIYDSKNSFSSAFKSPKSQGSPKEKIMRNFTTQNTYFLLKNQQSYKKKKTQCGFESNQRLFRSKKQELQDCKTGALKVFKLCLYRQEK